MHLNMFEESDRIISQGGDGSNYYILKAGKCEVIVNGQVSKQLKEGDGFGEIALLYNEKRTATVRAISDCECWVLDGQIFKKIVINKTKMIIECNLF